MSVSQEQRDTPSLTFGLDPEISRVAAEQLHKVLCSLWVACHQQSPAGVRPDLDLHRRYFDPVAQGRRLRHALLSLDPVVLPGPILPVQAITVDVQRVLITPEGRIAIELLGRALDGPGDAVVIDQALAARRERDLLWIYREWGYHRLRSVINLLGGGDKPLQIPAIGGVLTLLINRCDSPERAMKRFGPGTARDVIDDVFRTCADEFAQQLMPSSRRSRRKERLISGWTLGEVTRRMPDALHSSDEQGIFIVANRRPALISLLVAELQRRRDLDQRRFADAFDALTEEFSRRAQALAGYGLLFERPAETAQLKAEFVKAWTADI